MFKTKFNVFVYNHCSSSFRHFIQYLTPNFDVIFVLDYVNIWLGAIFNNRYEIDDLVSERKFSVNLNLQICFESNKPCDIDIQVFTNTKLPKKPCDWTTDFINEGE